MGVGNIKVVSIAADILIFVGALAENERIAIGSAHPWIINPLKNV
jgi:hypothetical protein